VKEIVRQIGGDVGFADAPGGGTVFFADLPAPASGGGPGRSVRRRTGRLPRPRHRGDRQAGLVA
jgi:hypothetical protein